MSERLLLDKSGTSVEQICFFQFRLGNSVVRDGVVPSNSRLSVGVWDFSVDHRMSGIVSGAGCLVPFTAAGASRASAQMIDRTGIMYGQAVVTAKFQQEGAKRELRE